MKALVLKDYWRLAVEELAEPEFGSGDVLLDVIATGICGSDVHGFTGESGRRVPGQVMGHETVGRVAGVGDKVRNDLRIGDLVTINPVISCGHCPSCAAGNDQTCGERKVIGVEPTILAAFAERLVVPGSNVVKLGDSLPAEHGALIEPLAVGFHAVGRANTTTADAVLVIGGGPIGQACYLGAVQVGARSVVVSEPNPSRRRLIEALGGQAVDPSGAVDLADRVGAALGTAPSVVIDAVGLSVTTRAALEVSATGARVVVVGMGAPELQLPAFAISAGERSIIGSYCYTAEDFRRTADWVDNAPVDLSLLIEGRVGLDDAPRAFDDLARGQSSASKVLVMPRAGEG